MNISLNWLKDYIKTDLNVEEVCAILTSIGLEVDGHEKVESIKGGLKGLVIGEVLTCVAHPDSDHLHVTTVNLGNGVATPIVCGAPNVAAGQKVIVATIGTILYDGDNEIVIKKSKIRGEVSEGMICAEDEIGIGKSHAGIIVLPNDAQPGTPAAEYYHITDDYVIEVDITPNRIDGASHIGIARDLAAYLSQKEKTNYSLPSIENFKEGKGTPISIKLERPEACRRYSGICIKGVTIKESPEWLQKRLKAIGLSPINNVVDVSNYVLMGLGQPLHTFDMDKIKGQQVIIKTYPTGTKFTTLDGIERSLNENDLMISNSEEPMCIAGVFGGLDSGISDQTTNVFLESACFDPVFVRKTARRHGLSTDASFRYERGTDPNIVIYALKYAALLIQEIAGGEIASEITDLYPTPVAYFDVPVKFDNIDRLIGKSIGHDTIKNILTSLEIKIAKEDSEGMLLQVPPYRVDVQREADIVEDILRIYGFNNIEIPSKVNSTLSNSNKPDDYKLKNVIGDLLAANGFNEIMCNSLTKASYYEDLENYNAENNVMLCNPLSSDLNAMRQSLIFGGLETIAYNINRKNNNLKLFEFGNCYHFNKKEGGNPLDQYNEESKLALFISGDKRGASWNSKEEKSSFYTAKAFGEMILKRLGFNIDIIKTTETKYNDLFREGIDYLENGTLLLTIGIVSSQLLKKTDVDQEVYYAEIAWNNVMKCLKSHKVSFVPMPKFHAVKRDLALLLDKKITFKEIKEIAQRTEKSLLKNVSLFDVYEGKNLPEGKKSYAVSFTLLDEEKTLTDKQIEKVMNKLIGSFQHILNAEIR